MKHAALAAAVVLYALVWGQNWTHYASALMLAAIRSDARASMRRTPFSPGLTLYLPDSHAPPPGGAFPWRCP